MTSPRLYRSTGPFEPVEAIRWQPDDPAAARAALAWLLDLGVGYRHGGDMAALDIDRIGQPALVAQPGDWVAHAAGYVAVASDPVFAAAYDAA